MGVGGRHSTVGTLYVEALSCEGFATEKGKAARVTVRRVTGRKGEGMPRMLAGLLVAL